MQLCEQVLVNIVSAAVKSVKQETIVKGFECCGYGAATNELNTQLRKVMCEPGGLFEVNESIDSVGFDDDDSIII